LSKQARRSAISTGKRGAFAHRSVCFPAPLVKFGNPGEYQVDEQRLEQDIFARPQW